MTERHQNRRGVRRAAARDRRPWGRRFNADIRAASGGQAPTSEAVIKQPRGADDQIVHFQRR